MVDEPEMLVEPIGGQVDALFGVNWPVMKNGGRCLAVELCRNATIPCQVSTKAEGCDNAK